MVMLVKKPFAQAGEALLVGAHVLGQARPDVVQRVHDGHVAGRGQAAGDQVGAEELDELRL